MDGKPQQWIRPGERWLDTEGKPIAAHGGGMLFHDGVYCWFGETRESFGTFPGFSCYSSRDLITWKNEGYALAPVRDDQSHDLYETNIIERPKVVYNRATKRFVMWMHVEDNRYTKACAGIAVSDRPTGPYRYIRSLRPNGHESRDCSLFQDDDGSAYFIHSSESNSIQHVNLLTADYLDVEGSYIRNWVHEWREAPAVFKHDGRYYSVTSLCTGFSPNKALYACADSMLGEWTIAGNPCAGPGKECCFRSQVSYIQPVAGRPGTFIFMADRWTPSHLADSRYVWLPFTMTGDAMRVEWLDRWNLDEQTAGCFRENPQGPRLPLAPGPAFGPSMPGRAPDIVIKRRIPDQQYSALAWLAWEKRKLHLAVAVYQEGSSSLDSFALRRSEEVVDIWTDYFQTSLDLDGRIWKTVPGGSGYGDLSGIELTEKSRHPGLSCACAAFVSSPHNGLLQLPENAGGRLLTVTIDQSALDGREIDKGAVLAFSLVLNNPDRSGKGLKNRGYSPAGWRWADTDTYHRMVLAATA